MSSRTDAEVVMGNRANQLFSIGANPISLDNPLPVNVSSIPMGKGSYVLSYDSSNNLTKVVQTLGSDKYTLNLTYDSSNNLTNVSKWVKS